MSSTIASSVSSAAGAGATGGPACNNAFELPVQDAACGILSGGNATDVMTKCCGDANVISYYDDCGLYCLAIDQSVGDLQDCLGDEGAVHGRFFCSGNKTETATATGPGDVPASASASLVASGGSSSSNDDDDDDSSSGSGNSGSSSNGDDDDDDSAAATAKPFLGMAIGALLFSATAFGAFAL